MPLLQFLHFAVLLVFTLLAQSTEQGCEGSPTVTIAQGTLRGRRNVTAQGTEYCMFLGIPYAAPPVGSLRFVAPQPPELWYGVRNASNFGSPCTQYDYSSVVTGDEDCLFLNVFTPKLPGSSKVLLPVMVYIHYGEFVFGNGNISPGHLMDYEVLVVSMNYRLDVFGFLSVEGTDATGNAGLKDQVAALRWVRKNIAHFGGDPHSVTIFGAGTGGACCHYHMLSPLSRGLFHRAIFVSGVAIDPDTFTCRTIHNAYILSYIVGRPATNPEDLITNLRTTPARELASAVPKILGPLYSNNTIMDPLEPSMEYPRAGEKPFMLQSPECTESAGWFTNVPCIIGFSVNEVADFFNDTVLSQPSYFQNINNDLEQIVPKNLGLKKGSQISLKVARKIKEFYFGNETISYNNRRKWLDLLDDSFYAKNIQAVVISHERFSAITKSYNYLFEFNNATHLDALRYMFYSGDKWRGNGTESTVAEHFGRLWTSFAKNGVPTIGDGLCWPSVSKNKFPYLRISTSLELDKNLENDRINFWAYIYRNYRLSGPCC